MPLFDYLLIIHIQVYFSCSISVCSLNKKVLFLRKRKCIEINMNIRYDIMRRLSVLVYNMNTQKKRRVCLHIIKNHFLPFTNSCLLLFFVLYISSYLSMYACMLWIRVCKVSMTYRICPFCVPNTFECKYWKSHVSF